MLRDHTGEERALSEFWRNSPALIMFWRHFGCSCGVDRGRLGIERVLSDAPAQYLLHTRAQGLVGTDGHVRLSYVGQHCDDHPDPRILTAAAGLA